MIAGEIWKRSMGPVAVNELPLWPCPTCNKGKLLLDRKSLACEMSHERYRPIEFERDDFEENKLLGFFVALGEAVERMQWNQARFCALLKCDNQGCNERVSMSGRAEMPSAIQVALQKQSGFILTERILPEYFSPPLQIIRLRAEYPEPVRIELIRSFTIFFSEPNSAGNRLRVAIERLLDAQTVPSGKLHHRLDEFSKRERDLAEMLMAIKWLGNEGSHSDKLTKEDVLNGYEVFSFVLLQLYVVAQDRHKMRALSQQLLEKYKPKNNPT